MELCKCNIGKLSEQTTRGSSVNIHGFIHSIVLAQYLEQPRMFCNTNGSNIFAYLFEVLSNLSEVTSRTL